MVRISKKNWATPNSLHLCGEPSGFQDRRGVIIRIHSCLRSLRVGFAPQPRRFRFRVPLSRVRLPLIDSFRRISISRFSIVTACVRCARRSRDRTTAATTTMMTTAAATSTYLDAGYLDRRRLPRRATRAPRSTRATSTRAVSVHHDPPSSTVALQPTPTRSRGAMRLGLPRPGAT